MAEEGLDLCRAPLEVPHLHAAVGGGGEELGVGVGLLVTNTEYAPCRRRSYRELKLPRAKQRRAAQSSPGQEPTGGVPTPVRPAKAGTRPHRGNCGSWSGADLLSQLSDGRTAPAHRERGDSIAVTGQLHDLGECATVPYHDRLRPPTRGEQAAVWRAGDG